MQIVHISDLHFGSRFDEYAFSTALDEINELGPDLLMVTGDLADEGMVHEFETARRNLKRFKCKKKVICPGNHDYRNTGYLLFKDYLTLKHVIDIDVGRIVVLKTARPDKDEGEVGYRQQLWMEEKFKGSVGHRIVMMHHHLVPIPDTGLERHTVIDAGDVLRSLRRSDVDLVLCGHKHRPWRWDFGDMRIVHAGSLSDKRLRGFFQNSYNIHEIDERRIESRVKIIGGDEQGFEDLTR